MAAQEESVDQFEADAFGSTLVADDGGPLFQIQHFDPCVLVC